MQTTATATVSASGTYTVNVTSANGCSSSCSTTITLPSLNCTGIRTEAQGTWGASATAYNASGYMNTNFAAAFPSPNYLTIGCGSRLMRFTSGSAVITALPTYGTPAQLATGTSVNPSSPANTLVGQIVSLRLAIGFDQLDPNFSSSDVLLKDMLVTSGTFGGWTVQQLLNTAEQVIGGCASTYPLSTLSTALTNVNNGYQGGIMNSGYLSCPGSERMLWETDGEEVNGPVPSATIFPNPFSEWTTIVLDELDENEVLTVEVLSADGKVVDTPYNGLPSGTRHQFDWQVGDRAPGLYLMRITQAGRMWSERLMVQ